MRPDSNVVPIRRPYLERTPLAAVDVRWLVARVEDIQAILQYAHKTDDRIADWLEDLRHGPGISPRMRRWITQIKDAFDRAVAEEQHGT